MPSPSPSPLPVGVHRVGVRPIQVAEKRLTPPSALSSSCDEQPSPAMQFNSSPSSSPLFSASKSASDAPVLFVSEKSSSSSPPTHSSLSAVGSSSSTSSSSSASSLLSVHSTVAFHRNSSSRTSTSSVPRPSPPPRRHIADTDTSNLSVRCGHYSMQGLRAEMEDKVVLLPHPQFNSTAELLDCVPRSYFAVFDGHGGDVSAEYCLTEDMEVLTDRGFMSRAKVFAACPELVASMAAAPMESDVVLPFGGVLGSRASSLCSTPSPLCFASLDPSTGHLVYLTATALTVNTVTSLVEFTHAAEAPHWAADADEYGLTPQQAARMQAQSDRNRNGEKVVERFGAEQCSNGVSVIVDSQHDMFVRVGGGTAGQRTRWESTNYHKVKAGALVSDDARQRVKMTGRAPAGLAASADAEELPFAAVLGLTTTGEVTAFLELYGYWLGDGYLDAQCRSVAFAPKKERDKVWVEERLATLGLTERDGGVRVSDMANGQRITRITPQRWNDYFFSEYGPMYGVVSAAVSPAGATHTGLSTPNVKSDKWFWMWVRCLRKHRACLVLAGLLMADGSEATDRNVIFTSGVTFRDDIVRLALHAGYSARFSLEYKKGAHRGYSAVDGTANIAEHDGWAVSYTDHDSAADPVLWNHRDIKRCAVPSGVTVPVWCVTVPPHHLIITRRVNKNANGVVTQASKPVVVGNCVAAGSLVALADGTALPVEQVQAGAYVLSYHAAAGDGKTEGLVARKVEALLDQGVKECVELLFSDGRTLVCTPDHRIRTADRRWLPACDLLVGTDKVAVGVEYAASDKITYGVHCNARVLPLFRERLVGIRPAGPKHVYDLTVPSPQGDDTASFTANGVVVHNCKQHVHLNFLAEPAFATAPSKALHNALLRTDNEFCAACRRINLMSSSGTTALCAFIQRHTLTVANIGDSRAILIKRSGAVQPLSSDHKPGRRDEKARIEALGGRVAVSEEDAWSERSSSQPSCNFLSACFPSTRPLRVFPGGLSVSRTIGDIGVKGMKLVIAEAEVWEADLRCAEDQFIILACDGVWDVLSNQHVADLCKKWDDKQQQQQQQGATKGGKQQQQQQRVYDELAECIAKEAFKRGSSDNISVVVISLDWRDVQPTQQEEKEDGQQEQQAMTSSGCSIGPPQRTS